MDSATEAVETTLIPIGYKVIPQFSQQMGLQNIAIVDRSFPFEGGKPSWSIEAPVGDGFMILTTDAKWIPRQMAIEEIKDCCRFPTLAAACETLVKFLAKLMTIKEQQHESPETDEPIVCVVCGQPPAFPAAIKLPYTCLQCQTNEPTTTTDPVASN